MKSTEVQLSEKVLVNARGNFFYQIVIENLCARKNNETVTTAMRTANGKVCWYYINSLLC